MLHHSLEEFVATDSTPVVTIGTFDGVHLGHQAVLQAAKEYKRPVIVLTFTDHPAKLLFKTHPPMLCTLQYKYHLLQQAKVDQIIALNFTEKLLNLSAEQFIVDVRRHIPFSHLVLGYDARIGKDRKGDQQLIHTLGSQYKFSPVYIAPVSCTQVVSSTNIRKLLSQGKLKEVKQMLGRWPSYYGLADAGKGLATKMGFPTLNLDISDLCTPPLGVYAVEVKIEDRLYKGVANIGHAPTVRQDRRILLESFLFTPPFKRAAFEVFLKEFLRPEKKFPTLDALQKQIAEDVKRASTV